MPARILAIGTAVPDTVVPQNHVRDFFAAQPDRDRLTQRLIHAAFDAAAIDRRHTVVTDLAPGGDTAPASAVGTAPISGAGTGTFVADDVLLAPSTGTRNDIYCTLAPPLSAAAAREALHDADVPASAVTHVITVSCTGFFAPGPDYRLIRDLGLSPAVERYHLGFIGCAAAFPAIRMAARITAAQPEAVVLVVCTELCTLHVRSSTDPQQIVASSVFADGSAAAVITADTAWQRSASDHGAGIDLDRFASTLTADGEDDMVWTIGDEGFEMILSAEVPRIIGREIRGAVDAFLGDDPAPAVWAVHPGGRSVLDRVETGLDLDPSVLTASRDVLRDYGNMSSATILFILRSMLHDDDIADGERIAGLAFGPGLTVESALFTKRGSAVRGGVDRAPAEHAPAEHAPAEHAPAEHGSDGHEPTECLAPGEDTTPDSSAPERLLAARSM